MWPWAKNDAKIDLLQKAFDDHTQTENVFYERLEKKLDRMDSRLDSIDVTLGKQQTVLDDHIKRTEILESKVEQDASHAKQLSFTLKLLKWATIAAVLTASGLGVRELVLKLLGG